MQFFWCAFCGHQEHVEEVYNGPAQEALKKLEDVEQDLQGGWGAGPNEFPPNGEKVKRPG